MSNNDICITTIRCNPTGTRQEWIVVCSWLLLFGGGVMVIIFESGFVALKWLLLFVFLFILAFSRRIFFSLLKPKEIEFYEQYIAVHLRGFNIEREWIIDYKELSVTCIGFEKHKSKKLVVIGDTTNYWHSCSLDYSSGWNDAIQEEVLAQLRITSVKRFEFRS